MSRPFNKFAFVICTIFFTSVAFSQISISPPILNTRIAGSSFKTLAVVVLNESESDYNCEMIKQDMQINEQGMPIPFADGAARGCSGWVEFTPHNFVLKAKQSKKVLVKVAVPRDRSYMGGYYALLSCEGAKSNDNGSGGERSGAVIRFKSKVSSVLMLTIKGPRLFSNIEIKKLGFSPKPVDDAADQGWSVVANAFNNGNMHITMEGETVIRGKNGVVIDKQPLRAGRGYVLPGSERVFHSRGIKNLGDGLYFVDVELYPQGQKSRAKAIKFSGKYAVKNGRVVDASAEDYDILATGIVGSGFSMDPQELKIEGVAGAKRFSAVRLTNLTNRTLQITAGLKSFNQTKDGKFVLSGDTDNLFDGTRVLELQQKEVTLRPKGSHNFRLKVNIPRTLDREYRALITFVREGQEINDKTILGQSLPCYVMPRNLFLPNLEIRNFSYRIEKSKRITFNIQALNLSPHRLWIDGNIILRDKTEKMVSDILQVSDASEVILPETARDFTVSFNNILDSGVYFAELTLNFDKNQKGIFRRIQITIP